MKILILRFSSIGDIVLTSPVIRTLKTHNNNFEIHYATKKQYNFILEENPYIDKIHRFDHSLSELIKDLRRENFDLIIDLHNNLRTAIIKLTLGIKSHSVNKLNLRKFLLTHFHINLLPNKHIVDRYMDCVAPLGVKMDNLGLDYFVHEKDEVEWEWLPASHQKTFVAVVIGGTFYTKKLPYNKLIELCSRINRPIILLGGNEEFEVADRIEKFFNPQSEAENEKNQKLNHNTVIFNGCGKFNFNQSASLIRKAQIVFSHDTGLMHVAAAYKKELYTIWGNTIPEFGMYPYRTKFTLLENKKLNCRPCSKIGKNHCPKSHFKCMNEIQFDFYLTDYNY